MNSISTFPVGDREKATWSDATRSVNEWRGQLIYWFTRGEAAVSDTLEVLAALEGRTSRPKLRHLSGQRSEDLYAALSGDGPFAAEGENAAGALASFREHEGLRHLLCHGRAKVWQDQSSGWAVSFELIAFRSCKVERTSEFFEQWKTETQLKDVRRCCQRMESALTALRSAVTKEQ